MKIQVLELPTEHTGEYSHTPYALIASEVQPKGVENWGKALGILRDDSEGSISWTLATEDEVEL